MTRKPTLEEIAAVLDNSKLRNGELRAACPAHGGEDANLSLRYDGNKLLAQCHSHHCAFEAIMVAIRERLGEPAGGEVVEITRNGRPLNERKSKNEAVRNRTTWELRDEAGKLVALHVRDDLADGDKKVWWRLPSGKTGLDGKSTSELPLYGCQDIVKTSVEWVVVAEGEKAADALRGSRGLREAGVAAVGTVTGASGTPGAEALGALRGRRVVLWPDNDSTGLDHMGRVAQALQGVAAEVRWFEWEEAAEKGDAADHPDVGSLAPTLKLAPRWSKPPAIEGRVLLGQAIELGIEPPEELLPDMLLAGKAHNIFAPGGVGKTWLLVWIATELVRRGKKVVVFDLENGHRTYAERFEEIGADPNTLDDLLYYYPFPAFDYHTYEQMLDDEQPDIVMFDSWIGFLSADGLEESENKDISTWAVRYSKPALRRGCAVAVLDHVPHEHDRERGASRKRDEMDVVWKLTKLGDFDRDKTATLSLTRQKDREGWLPEKLTFEIGGDPTEGFVMRRDDNLARVEVTHTTKNEKLVLGLLDGSAGLKTAEWQKQALELGIKRSPFYRLIAELLEKGKVVKEDGLNILNQPLHLVVPDGPKLVPGTSGTTGGTEEVPLVPLPKGSVGLGGTSSVLEPPSGGSSGTKSDKPFTELPIEEKRKRFKENVARAYPRKDKDDPTES